MIREYIHNQEHEDGRLEQIEVVDDLATALRCVLCAPRGRPHALQHRVVAHKVMPQRPEDVQPDQRKQRVRMALEICARLPEGGCFSVNGRFTAQIYSSFRVLRR